MISVYQLKPAFQKLMLQPMALLHRWRLTANHITLAAIGLSAILGICLWHAPSRPILFWLIQIGLFLRMALNAIDGMMARIYNQQSKLGEVLNEMGDICSDVFLFIPLLTFPSTDTLIIVLFLLSAIINETAGILAKIVGGERRYDGPMGKSDRALLLGALCLLLGLGLDPTNWLNYVLFIAITLMTLSSITRLKHALS